MQEEGAADPVTGLEEPVANRIVGELEPRAGRRVLRCLATARSLLDQHSPEADDLRYAESAAYNIREALDSVARDGSAEGGGLATAMRAWARYQSSIQLPGADEPFARSELAETLNGLASNQDREAHMTRRLLEWLRRQTGVEPLTGDGDPAVDYNRLRMRANEVVHGDGSAGEVRDLLADTLAWFGRLFTPPSDIARRIQDLARYPYSPDLLIELRTLALYPHHLRLFLEYVEDPSWLGPMRESGLIRLPQAGETWPAASLTWGQRRLPDEPVVALLHQFLEERTTLPRDERAGCSWEIMRTASRLGPSGHGIVLEVLRLYPTDDWVQMIAMSSAREVDVTDPIWFSVADAVIGNEPRRDGGHRTRETLQGLVAGLTAANVQDRVTLISTKVRRFAADEHARFVVLDLSALVIKSEEARDPLVITAECLAEVMPTALELGMSGPTLLEEVKRIPGEVGERLACQVLAGSSDIDRETKISHLMTRFASENATGDDKALIDALEPFDQGEIVRLRDAFGSPSSISDPEVSVLGDNWPRGWHWSMVLPSQALVTWEAAIAAVTELHGSPDPSLLSQPRRDVVTSWVGSPISAEDLTSLDVMECSAVIGAWRPSPDDSWGVSARELARTMERLVVGDPQSWTQDPPAIVRTLREPVYVTHYLRGVATIAADIRSRAPQLIRAIELARTERWEPAVLGRDEGFDYEPDWSGVDSAAVSLIDALADADAELAGDLSACWMLATTLVRSLPEDLGTIERYTDPVEHVGALDHAINTSYGKGLEAVIALGGWEHRNIGSASDHLASELDEVLVIDGAVGVELRSIIAGTRPFLEAIAADWFAQHHDDLFSGPLGKIAFDETVKYSRPTKVFYDRSLRQLLQAAHRGSEHAVAWLLIAYLWEEPAYTFDAIVDGLRSHPDALVEAGHEVARLSTGITSENAQILDRGIEFWEQLLTEAGRRVPPSTLRGLGRWALTPEVPQARWLELTEKTILLTGGVLDQASYVAERCRDAQPSSAGLRILDALLGHGERWEQQHVEDMAVEALRAATEANLSDETVGRLREHLIQRGRHDAP